MNWEKYDIDTKGHRRGQHKVPCPQCKFSNRRHKNDPSLSINLESGMFKCHYCNFKGCAKEYEMQTKKEYIIPNVNITQLPDKALEWFKKRFIGQATVLRFKLFHAVKRNPKTSHQQGC